MFSYMFMKILEKTPSSYDRVMNLLSRGHAQKTLERIVSDFIEPGMRVLDVGCGTGTFAIMSARKGATVVGIDSSPDMISVARKKVKEESLSGNIELLELNVTGLADVLPERKFDRVVATLVLSELFSDERSFLLWECRGMLEEDGLLIIADETLPEDAAGRILYEMIRLPLALLTFVISGKGTRAIPGLEKLMKESGFEVSSSDKTGLGSFTIAVAGKVEEPAVTAPKAKKTPPFKRYYSPVLERLLRWFPNPAEPGLRIIGEPGRDSPVFISANYTLSEKILRKNLARLDCYLLLAPTGGINVWCSSCEGNFNAGAVASVMRSSRIGELVDHRRVVLPQLCAPGVSARELSRLTGWEPLFGPVRSRYIPEYIDGNYQKTPDMRTYDFDVKTSLDLALSMNFMYFPFLIALARWFRPKWVFKVSILFWAQTLATYTLFRWIPGRYGITRALATGAAFGSAACALGCAFSENRKRSWKWLPIALGIGLVLGMDSAGITGILRDEPLMLANKLGIRKAGPFTIHEMGRVTLDGEKCVGCASCVDVCPRGVFRLDESTDKSGMVRSGSCTICKACIMQCPSGALVLAGTGRDMDIAQVAS